MNDSSTSIGRIHCLARIRAQELRSQTMSHTLDSLQARISSALRALRTATHARTAPNAPHYQ
jgi:hypothetical protein